MQKSRWWDWPAVLMLFALVEIAASRLVSTEWTPFLSITRTVVFIGFTVGTALGFTRFSQRVTHWLSFLYMLLMLPLQWTLVIDQNASLEEQFLSVAGRLNYSLAAFFARRSVEDPILFITLMTVVFWIVSAIAGFQLIRHQRFLAAVLPSAAALFIIQSYDNAIEKRALTLALYALIALLLLGRLNYLENKQSWNERRIFYLRDNSVDLTNVLMLTAGLIVLVSWSIPASVSSLNAAVERWNRLVKPWKEFTQRMDNAFDALRDTSTNRGVDYFQSGLSLGTGFSLSDTVIFSVQVPEIPDEDMPPRFYWQGRIYDNYENGRWYNTNTARAEFIPSTNTLAVSATSGQPRFRFSFFTRGTPLSLLYAPAQPVWVSRAGSTLINATNEGEDITAWFASPMLEIGESYQVESAINNPSEETLKSAGTNYPAWVTDKYLQLPDDFSPRVRGLATRVTEGAETPYDQAVMLTRYLRQEIEYSASVQAAPDYMDSLEWFLFDYKKGYCVYYATAETLMLRSLGIPARMVAGFAQGEYSPEENQYMVRKLDAHAWPQVYFPGIGWVEFEPTGSQPELDRPLEDVNVPLAVLPTSPGLEDDQPLPFELQTPETQNSNTDANASPVLTLYLIPLFVIIATLTVYFTRRYAVPSRIPVLLRDAYERNGLQVPAWILNWEQWMNISTIERSFESINFGLRLLDKPMPVYATPIERAGRLAKLFPKIESDVNTLLDEHQTSLYTSRQADVTLARRTAFKIRWQVLLERVRYLVEGKPVES